MLMLKFFENKLLIACRLSAVFILVFCWSLPSIALELDWSGQFRTGTHWIRNYALDSDAGRVRDTTKESAGGYYIPGGGASNASFQTLFMRLRPTVVVNDNIYVKSDWWLGDPVFGFFGNAAPYTPDQRQFYSSQSRSSIISAQRFWGEFLSDVGTVQVGRVPLHWGLGLTWNSGEGVWDRYASTGDAIRLLSKFGSFSFSASIIKYSMGNTIAGACVSTPIGCSTIAGGGGLSDYSLLIKYENPDEDFEGGVNFIKRLAGAGQDPNAGFMGPGLVGSTQASAGMNYNTWDLYGRKKFGKFSVAGEVPIVTGELAGLSYKTYAIALETAYRFSDRWEVSSKLGRAPGQPNAANNQVDKFKSYFFNPNYQIGLIMFNYQLANFAGPHTVNNPITSQSTLLSPFDNPITNANYFSLHGGFSTDKWNFHSTFVMAKAVESAINGSAFFNSWRRRFYPNVSQKDQDSFLGWELDLGTTFKWDDFFLLALDGGIFFPGGFYKFSNVGTDNPTSSVIAGVAQIGVTF